MYVITEKRQIVGTLKTLVGTYQLLDMNPIRRTLHHILAQNGALAFHGLDDEGYVGDVIVRGDFAVVPVSVPVQIDVKRVLSEEEQKTYNLSELSVIE